jgi:membrane protein
MSATEGDDRVARLRVVANGIAARVGGVPAVRMLAAVLETYDHAGGGLVAGGLAYSALIALLPGLLLVLSVFGLVVTDPAIQSQLVDAISTAVPPLADFAETALTQVSAGAVPGGIIAVIGLVWASSRFYSALDYAIARIFRTAKTRNEIVRSVRGVVLVLLLVALPIVVVFAGTIVQALLDLIPDRETRGGLRDLVLQLATPVGAFALFVVATVMVYALVPSEHVPSSAWRRPALVVGLLLALFTQVFAIIAPLMTRISALYGALVAVFALLAWLSIGFNILLIGAAWTRVRALAMASTEAPPAVHGAGEEPG